MKGALSRWLLEPKTGIFLGNPSARVRDELWKQAVMKIKANGSAMQIWTDNTPQGFSYRQIGVKERKFVEVEGVSLIQKIQKNEATANDVMNNENADPETE